MDPGHDEPPQQTKRQRTQDTTRHDLAAANEAHDAWTTQFIADHGRRPVRDDIEADAHAAPNAKRMRELTIAAAEPFVSGQCQHFIWRKKRYCASRAAHSNTRFCSDHEPTKLAQLQRDSIAGQQQKLQGAPSTGHQGLQIQDVQPLNDRASAGPRRGRGVKTNQERNPKRMTNPLSKQFQIPVPAPDWPIVYADLARPLLLDIGCARGRFLQDLALRRPESYNYCGVEIFAPLVVAANEWAAKAAAPPNDGSDRHCGGDGSSGGSAGGALRHLFFIAANINASIESLQFPNLRVVCLQFPDPWHAKHGKRRVMSNAFAHKIAALLPARGLFYFCSDHAAIAWHIRECILQTGWFQALSDDEIVSYEANDGLLWGKGREVAPTPAQAGTGPAPVLSTMENGSRGSDLHEHEFEHEHLAGRGEKSKCRSGDVTPATATGGALASDGAMTALPQSKDGWLKRSPFPVPTERDRVCELKWRPVWRMMLYRTEAKKQTLG